MRCCIMVNAVGAAPISVKKTTAALFEWFTDNSVFLEAGQFTLLSGQGDEEIRTDISPFQDVLLLNMGTPSAAAAVKALSPGISGNTLYLMGNDDLSREMAARLAAAFGGSAVPDADALAFEDGRPVCRRLIYSGHMEGVFKLERAPYFVCLNDKGKPAEYVPAPVRRVSLCPMDASGDQDMEFSRRAKPGCGIGDAAFLIAAGSGIRDGADLEQLRVLAARMDGILGVSRSLGVRPYAKDDPVLGISGAAASAAVCLAVGVSGASAFYAGIEHCAYIAAINNDENAPILSKCDCAAVEDYRSILSELSALAGRKRRDD